MLDRRKAPELRSFDDLQYDYPSYITLKNGIKLYVVNNGDQEVNKLELIYKGGLLEERKPLQSFALASMLVHGSDRFSSNEVAEILDYNGSYLNATNHDNFTQVSLNSLNKNFNDVLPVLQSIIQAPAIPEREFDVLKSQIKSAYQTARQRVKYLSQIGGRKLYFGSKHPFAHMITDEDVDNLTADDVKTFHSTFYKPDNCTMILSGKVSDREIALIENAFGQESPVHGEAKLKEFKDKPFKRRFLITDKPGALQSSVYMIHKAISRNHEDYIKLRILITALGGYFGSRLMQNIREDKGYTYGINAMLVGRRNGAKVVVASECDTAYTYLLIDEVKNEIRKLQEQPLCVEELEMVKNCMLSDLAKTLDSPFSMASCVSSNILFGTGEDYFNRQVEEIVNIGSDELLEVANKYLDVNNFYVSVAGDKKQLKLYRK